MCLLGDVLSLGPIFDSQTIALSISLRCQFRLRVEPTSIALSISFRFHTDFVLGMVNMCLKKFIAVKIWCWSNASLCSINRLQHQGDDVVSLAKLFSPEAKKTVGTACSGTDSPVISLMALTDALRMLGFKRCVPVTHVFSCEAAPPKQAWIKGMCCPHHLFSDIRELGQNYATDVVNYEQCWVPDVFLFIAGFSCKSVSFLNVARSQHQQSCAMEEGETGITFGGVRKYLISRMPYMFLLENVVGLRSQLENVESEWWGPSDRITQ